MLYKANQMPPVLTNNSPIVGQSMPPAANNSINPMMTGLQNHFPSANQDVDLRSAVDPRLNRNMDMDMRSMPTNPVPNPNIMDSTFMRQGKSINRKKNADLPAISTFSRAIFPIHQILKHVQLVFNVNSNFISP